MAIGRQLGIGRDRRVAGAVELGQAGALGAHAQGRRAVIERRQQRAQAVVVGAHLDADGALTDCRKNLPAVDDGRRLVEQAQPLQSGHRQQRRIGLAGRQLAQPRLHIAAQGNDLEVRPEGQQLRLPPQRRGADGGAPRQLGDARACPGEQRVARILARQHRADDEPRGQPCRHVLHRMHRAVDAAVEQRFLDLLGEQALAADLHQLAVLHGVAGGLDRHDLNIVRSAKIGMGRRQAVAHHPRLHQRQRTPARTDADRLVIRAHAPRLGRHASRCKRRAVASKVPTVPHFRVSPRRQPGSIFKRPGSMDPGVRRGDTANIKLP